jgi:hypothetical protein
MLPLPLLLAGAFRHPFATRVAFASSSSSACSSCGGAGDAHTPRRNPSRQPRRATALRSTVRHPRGGGDSGDFGSHPAADSEGKRRRTSATSATTAMYSSLSPPMLEVEEKFDLMSSPSAVADVERRLSTAGFVQQYVVEMVDWYFDDVPTYSLALNDCWLRYRREQRRSKPTRTSRASADDNDKEGGESAVQGWQLKRGTATSKDRPSSSGATVYEETEGIQALALACSLLVDPTSTTRSPFVVPAGAEAASAAVEFEKDSRYPIPAIPSVPQSLKSAGGVAACPAPPELVPFARIVTHRSHWIHKDPPNADAPGRFAGLVVDMDSTDFGHAVGEVEALIVAPMHDGARDANHQEAVVAAQDAVVAAQRLIREFLRHVIYHSDVEDDNKAGRVVECGSGADEPLRVPAPAQGKLECYLEKFRPELHAALVEAGILKRPSVQACDRRGS